MVKTSGKSKVKSKPDNKDRKAIRKGLDPTLKKLEERLLREKQSLTEGRARIRRRTSEIEGSLPNDETGEFDEGTVDLSNSLLSKEIDISVNDSLQESIHGIDVALRKIRDGTYGICDVCGGKISKARLEALPYATLCLRCQTAVEAF